VLKDDDNGTEASIQITGDPEKKKEAERLIKELVGDTSFPNSRYSNNTAQPSTNVIDQTDSAFVDWGAVIRDSVRSTLTLHEENLNHYPRYRKKHLYVVGQTVQKFSRTST
jgi:hypothetical protein